MKPALGLLVASTVAPAMQLPQGVATGLILVRRRALSEASSRRRPSELCAVMSMHVRACMSVYVQQGIRREQKFYLG